MDEGRTALVRIDPQVGHCPICGEKALCRAADVELARAICPGCFNDVLLADRVLWIAFRKAFGICRPQPGTLLEK